MKKYLEISNIGEISKSAIELLGFSDKRARTDLIGEKGTGLKFSRLQCLRKSIDVYVTTSSFKHWFSKKKIDNENDQVIFRYESPNGKTHAKASSYTVEAGFSDWTDDWFIIREIIQNAVDETKRNGLCDSRDEAMAMVLKCVRIVDKVSFAKKGNTNIYVEFTPAIEEVVRNLDKYFVYNPIFDCEYGSIHKKEEKDKIKIYKQGILIQEYSGLETLYNYECREIELQENRTPKYSNDVADEILKIYSLAPTNLKREFLRYCNRNTNALEVKWAWEHTRPLSNKESWVKAFMEEFGSKAVIHYDVAVPDHIAEKAELHKKTVIILQNPLYKFLSTDIPTLEELTSSHEDTMYKAIEPEGQKLVVIEKALALIRPLFMTTVPIKIYEPFTELEHNTGGVFIPNRNIILINANRASSVEEILPILIEEFIHAETGADDFSRAFQNFALKKMSQILLKTGVDIPICSDQLPF